MAEMPTSPLHRPRVAVVEDEDDLRESIVDYLGANGYPVWGAASGEAFFEQLRLKPVDVVVLDVQLPGEDGFSIAQRLHRRFHLGVVMASAREQVDDRLRGLSSGADVYLVKPVDLRELVANIESVFRRLGPVLVAPGPAAPEGGWRLDQRAWAWRHPDGQVLSLTPKEFLFVRALAAVPGSVVSRARIAQILAGERDAAGVEFHAIDVMVGRLRKKGLEVFGQPLPIRTVTGIGFTLVEPCRIVAAGEDLNPVK